MFPVYDIDRAVFASSLAVHIIISSLSIGMPFALGTIELYGVLKKDSKINYLVKRLSTIILALFAIGTLSGTIVAVEMATLFPKFMQIISNTAIISLYIEVGAFFIESLFLGLYLYSWKKYGNSIWHPIFMYLVGFFAAMSGVLIITLNSFMNYPVGVQYINGQIIDTDPYAIFFTPIQFIETGHGVLASLTFGVSFFIAIIAYHILREKDLNKIDIYGKIMKIVTPIFFISILVTGLYGISSIDTLSVYQPTKYAVLEANVNGNISHASENLFGFISPNYTLENYISVPDLQSLLLHEHFNPNTVVPGILPNESNIASPADITVSHNSFDIMAILGFIIFLGAGYMLLSQILSRKDNNKDKKFTLNPRYTFYLNKLILYASIILALFSIIAVETGWIAAEVGRQPWTIYNILLTKDAANLNPSVVPVAITFQIIYIILFFSTLWAIKKYFIDRLE
ncbi:cytochrome ubiquinol oxidase subunit I [Nanobdella aerobiophila]|uniref:Cytochrome ubiquinol oxidase subunit I n=1 Tax=Nanobdella aerobiophila TaxID=2586965 RepID=A0A915WR91_9ARCH|nr:cytochrome ubiquinol oxidase subunit I [Nanobdella aerobiophila]BBL45303.1 cytochrome ubiquinol oxidase subunit I [Nanobdella aerobiophila]